MNMTTAQDQQSRAEFDRYWLDRQRGRGFGDALTDEEMLARPHRRDDEFHAWQAARALPAGMEPAAEILSSRPGNDTSTIDKAYPDGTKLYTAAQVQAMLAQSDMGIPISAPLPPGWQAVPVEPTEEMKRGAQMAAMDHSDHDEWLEYEWQDVLRTWKGLLAAAPRPPAAQESNDAR